jgi:hypothetical protein
MKTTETELIFIKMLLNPSLMKKKVNLVNQAAKGDLKKEFTENGITYRLSKTSQVINKTLGFNKTLSIRLEVQLQELFETFYKTIGIYIPESLSDYMTMQEQDPNYIESDFPRIIILNEYKKTYEENKNLFEPEINERTHYLGNLENAFISMSSKEVIRRIGQISRRDKKSRDMEIMYSNGIQLSLTPNPNNTVSVEVIDKNFETKDFMTFIYGFENSGEIYNYTKHPTLDLLKMQGLIYSE